MPRLFNVLVTALVLLGCLSASPPAALASELADLVFERASGYTAALRRLKKVFDPNNIMNPGTLCF